VGRETFPATKGEIAAIRRGDRCGAVVPLRPRRRRWFGRDRALASGDRVVFAEAVRDLFGVPRFLPFGESVSVALTEVRDEHHQWYGQDLFYIAWEPLSLDDPWEESFTTEHTEHTERKAEPWERRSRMTDDR
jgi:hypothetical protein